MHEEAYEELRAARSPLLPREDCPSCLRPRSRYGFERGFYDSRHLWSGRAFARLKEVYPDGGPAVWSSFPTTSVRAPSRCRLATRFDPQLRNTQVCIRLYTTKEMTDVLNGHLPRPTPYPVSPATSSGMRSPTRIGSCGRGSDVLESYRRFYGGSLVEAELVRHAVLPTPPNDQPLAPQRSSASSTSVGSSAEKAFRTYSG